MIHHSDCPMVTAWDCGEEGAHCRCPEGWPKTERDFEEWYEKGKKELQEAEARTMLGMNGENGGRS